MLFKMSMRKVRKVRNCLTIEQKGQIIMALENGESSVGLSNKFKVSKSTITGIKKQGAKIKALTSQIYFVSAKKKNLRNGEFPEMETRLYKWFLKHREKKFPISGEILKMQAKFFFIQIYGEENPFSASSGWLAKFKRRYGIRLLDYQGEELTKSDLVSPSETKLDSKIRDLSVAALIQPTDQNNIKLTILHYRNYLLQNIVAQSDNSIYDLLTAATIRQASTLLTEAWQNVKEDNSVECWRPSLECSSDAFTDESNLPLSRCLQENRELADASRLTVPMKRFAIPNTNVADQASQKLKGDIVEISEEMDEEPSETEQTDTFKRTVPLHDAMLALNKVLTWALENECTGKEIMVLRQLRERAIHCRKVIQQTKILD